MLLSVPQPFDLSKLYRDLGEMVSRRREALGLTQKDLAVEVGLSRASIANIETGRQKVMLHQIFNLASALQLSAADLLPQVNVSSVRPSTLKLPDDLSTEQKRRISQFYESAVPQSRSARGENK
jgi:transcriptional regulator with XRE-family HTH domain